MSAIRNRYDFVYLFDVADGNPAPVSMFHRFALRRTVFPASCP